MREKFLDIGGIIVLSRGNIELKTSKNEFTDKSQQNKQGFEGKKLSGTDFTAFQLNVCQTMAYSANLSLTVFLPRFSRLVCLLSSRFLQNNLLVEIRRYKLSFLAKPATKFSPTGPPLLPDLTKIVA